MSTITIGQQVEHRDNPALGQGKVQYVLPPIAGVVRVGVLWSSATEPSQHTQDQLVVTPSLWERLEKVGPASRIPFQLKVFARWFEARHSLTGELSNQPFQMLPHQVVVTNKVVNSAPDHRAWLIADDVGLGKTIEAGMIMEVLRKKTIGRFRCLVVTPAGLMPQWQDELATRFGRNYRIFQSPVPNDLETVDQLLASIDTLKLAKFKQALQMVTPWDLVVFDEAHHLATTTSVLSYQLAHWLSTEKKARNLLFLTATPHSGNNEHFFNMLRLLRPDLFPRVGQGNTGDALRQVMIRNRKSDVTDIHHQRIFKGIAPAKIIPFAPTAEEVAFYEELREYLRTGYRVAERLQREKEGTKASAVGFLMSTFGKLASSSRAAIQSALENRRAALREETAPEVVQIEDERFAGEQAANLVGTAGLEVSAPGGKKKKKKESPIEGELAEVEGLLARLSSLAPGDSKLSAFLKHVQALSKDVKLLIFTEFRATQNVLAEALRKQFGADSVALINGSMDMHDRRRQVELFNEHQPNPRFMVSTEAGGEGLNMQKLCHTVVNYDLPWNPMALQQRIGRVYRYGQTRPVVVFNLKVESTSEAFADQRVYSYLETKIEEITRHLQEVQDGDPEDLRNEVLGQVASQMQLDELYKQAVEEGHRSAEKRIDSKATHIAQILADPAGMLGLFKGLERFDITHYEKVAARVSSAHLEFFIRQYLGHQGVAVKTSDKLLSFTVPRSLVDVSMQLIKSDPYQTRDTLKEAPIERATADKELAQKTLGCRLLRFGDAAFEAMVKHAQHGNFSSGVASIELPAEQLGWSAGSEGTWLLFDLKIVRQEGGAGGLRIVRNELASFLVPRGGSPSVSASLVESLHEATDGSRKADVAEARRAYELGRQAADQRLQAMYTEVTAEHGKAPGLQPQDVQDVALAWVRAG